MIDHAEDGYPEEICGAFLGHLEGTSAIVRHVIKLENWSRENRERRFKITPDDLFQLQQKADEMECEVVGFYHSHPDHPARPSETDLAFAWPRYRYVILSVRSGATVDMTGWILEPGTHHFQNVRITGP